MKFMYVQMIKGSRPTVYCYGKVVATLSGSSPVNHEHQIDFPFSIPSRPATIL